MQKPYQDSFTSFVQIIVVVVRLYREILQPTTFKQNNFLT